MSRASIDCRHTPNEVGCTLSVHGAPDEVLDTAVGHAVTVHGHTNTPELREMLRAVLAEDTSVSGPGAFLQVFEFTTAHGVEVPGIQQRWAKAIGPEVRARWSILARDRSGGDRYLAVVEFASCDDAMANSSHPATATFVEELTALCHTGPEFTDLDVHTADNY